jgi:hypothetical protein
LVAGGGVVVAGRLTAMTGAVFVMEILGGGYCGGGGSSGGFK